MKNFEISYYNDFISPELFEYLLRESTSYDGVDGLEHVGQTGGLETPDSFKFLCELYELLKDDLKKVLERRVTDRQFFDQRTKACFEFNKSLKIDFLDPLSQSVIGHQDARGRVVVGPKAGIQSKSYFKKNGSPIAPLPDFLQGHHVTLFGPPDDAKLSINAMNSFHRKIKGEPVVVEEILKDYESNPKWGADDEDSKTPLREDLISAARNLTSCFEGNLTYVDAKTQKTYSLETERQTLPIKRFPGLALPCTFLFYRKNPIPLHLYDFALHLYRNWHNARALSFYVPKLENEEEAAYIRKMVSAAEQKIHALHPNYKIGSIRLFIVLENPRAIFRVNEILDELYPYFAGASLGWHDYLASTARLFKEDSNYRIPVKADPDIVIKYIKASHDLLSDVVGSRGGIKIGGMYGILPMDSDLKSPSFQVTLKGYIKDVVIQMKRGLSGFWVAHPDFVRLGLALVAGWKAYEEKKDFSKLQSLVTDLLEPKYHKQILDFIVGPDVVGLDREDSHYPRSLLVADIKESSVIANNDPDEVRYNVFQSLQYLTDWLSGNGCVALPAQVDGVAVRVMDDLATAERSRWEVWHEIYHGRFRVEELVKIAHEEMVFIRKDKSDSKKIVQVKWDERTSKWYPIAHKLMLKLMTSRTPVEFATELLLPFTVPALRASQDPWAEINKIEPTKYRLDPYLERLDQLFSICGTLEFARPLAERAFFKLEEARAIVNSFSLENIREAASFHGDIGESKKTLDEKAASEQSLVLSGGKSVQEKLISLGAEYLKKFGVKYLVSAQGKTGEELLKDLTARLNNSETVELDHAREALWEISRKRLQSNESVAAAEKISKAMHRNKVRGVQIASEMSFGQASSVWVSCFGERDSAGAIVTPRTLFEIASLSKTVATCFALEYFRKNGISLATPVNRLLEKTSSKFRLKSLNLAHPDWANQATLENLMRHNAINLHYVHGVPANQKMPRITEFLDGNEQFNYPPIGVLNEPGRYFQYSGGGFLVLEHLIEAHSGQSIQTLTQDFLAQAGLTDFSFNQETQSARVYASGYLSDGTLVEGTRKMFPAFAAGAMASAESMCRFLQVLTEAYHNVGGSGPISHETAVQILQCTDRSSQKFMGVNLGIGVFTAEAGPNRLALHQGANDGFRSLFVHCYAGPDKGNGFTILCNGDSNGVPFVSEVAQIILGELKIQGIDLSKFRGSFESSHFASEEGVNQGYKELVFGAFEADLPEEIIERGARGACGPVDPLSAFNLAADAAVLDVSNQGFARAENLISKCLPVFDPELYGRHGKIMDSWETIRHNRKPNDELILQLRRPSSIEYVLFSTQFHLGNQAPAVTLEGLQVGSDKWEMILPETGLDGHSIKRIRLPKRSVLFSHIKVSIFPDGGLTRLGLFDESLPVEERKHFLPPFEAVSQPFQEVIPHPLKPLSPQFEVTDEFVQRNWAAKRKGEEVDVASRAFGGRVIRASNEHYGPASQVISPFPPINMFDGFESARSRAVGHFEEVVIALGRECRLFRVEFDFTYFKHNNPREISVEGLAAGQWVELVKKTDVKAFAGNKIQFPISQNQEFKEIKFSVFPDGGVNRFRAFTLL